MSQTTNIERRMKMAGIIACICAVAFALPHFWFAFGISLAYPGDFTPFDDTAILWEVGGAAILVAIYPIVFTRSSLIRRLPEFVIALPAWVGGIGLTLYGLSFFNLKLMLAMNRVQSTPQFAVQDASPNAIWGYYWYALFIVWGISLGITAFSSYKLRKSQNQSVRPQANPIEA